MKVNNTLEAEVATLAAIVEATQTPVYVYDLGILKRRILDLRQAFHGFEHDLYFATMANDQQRFLTTLSALGLGACVNSIDHLSLAVDSGFPHHRIQFTASGLSRADMHHALSRKIAVNLDSALQLRSWLDLGGQCAGLRVNAASFGFLTAQDRMGIPADEIKTVIDAARNRNRVVDGLHIYVGTNFKSHTAMLPTLQAFFDLAGAFESLSYINIGGGIGVDYEHSGQQFNIGAFGKELEILARRLNQNRTRRIRVIVEPGRGIAAASGVFVTAVTDVKELNGTRFVAVDGSIAVFPRPFHHPESPHRIRMLRSFADEGSSPAVIVGRTTFSKDILGKASLPRGLRTGDLLVIDDAGAYSQSMISRFLGQPAPKVAYRS